jgi:hypothetical protein
MWQEKLIKAHRTLLLQCCYTVVTLLSHCGHTIVTLLLRNHVAREAHYNAHRMFCVCVFWCLCVCVYVSMCEYICVCVCVFVFACPWSYVT